MANASIDIKPVGSTAGAEIRRVDLGKPLEDAAFQDIRRALFDYGVIFFRDQNITPGQQLDFAKRFGPAQSVEFLTKVDGFDEIGEIRKDPDDTDIIGDNWHCDHSFDAIPPLGVMSIAREIPAVGGDTLFANMRTAYDSLSDGLKKTLEGLRAVHHATRRVKKAGQAEPETITLEAIHPAVPRHPDSGRKVLFVNPTYTVRFDGWTEEESAPLLRYLFSHATRPENTCRFHWHEGSVAFWDNRSSLHCAINDYHAYGRLLHRITIDGSAFG